MAPNFCLKPLSNSCGAVIEDIDLKQVLNQQQFSCLREGIVKYKVLVLRGQKEVTPNELRRFSCQWGELSKNGFTLTKTPVAPDAPFKSDIAGRSDMQIFENHANSAVGRGNVWHSDVSYKKNPPAYTILQAHILPKLGGDTLFMDMEKAVSYLPNDLLSKIKYKSALHSGDAFIKRLEKQLVANPILSDHCSTYHPLISKHPHSGKPVLFYNMDLVNQISGCSQKESTEIIATINNKLSNCEEIIYRHRWKIGDILIWDNRALMHYASYDYGKASRLMYRTMIDADIAPQPMF